MEFSFQFVLAFTVVLCKGIDFIGFYDLNSKEDTGKTHISCLTAFYVTSVSIVVTQKHFGNNVQID